MCASASIKFICYGGGRLLRRTLNCGHPAISSLLHQQKIHSVLTIFIFMMVVAVEKHCQWETGMSFSSSPSKTRYFIIFLKQDQIPLFLTWFLSGIRSRWRHWNITRTMRRRNDRKEDMERKIPLQLYLYGAGSCLPFRQEVCLVLYGKTRQSHKEFS